MKVPMKTKRAMRYAGRDMKAGEEFNAESESHASIWERNGSAVRRDPVPNQYQTRMMTAETLPRRTIESMEVEELRALAARKGIKVHHRAGIQKLRAALRQS